MKRESFLCLIWLNPFWLSRSQNLIMGTTVEMFTFPMVRHKPRSLNHAAGKSTERDIFSPYIPRFTSVEVILRPPQDCLDARQELQIKNHKHFGALNPKTFSSIKLKTWGNGHMVLTGIERARGTIRGPPNFKTLWGSVMHCLEHLPKGISLTVKQPLKRLLLSHRSPKVLSEVCCCNYMAA